MARFIHPTTFLGWVKLFGTIKAKHVLDGVDSILTIFFEEQDIVIGEDQSNINDAKTADGLFSQKEKDCKKIMEEIDTTIRNLDDDHIMCAQLLKKFYRRKITSLGAFGITTSGNKIVYKENKELHLLEIKALIDHHNSLAAGTSPLSATFLDENSIDLVANLALIAPTITKIALWVTTNDAKETQCELRDTLSEKFVDDCIGTGDFLLATFSKNPHKAGDWGIQVDSSPQKDSIRDGEVDMLDSKVLYHLKNGSHLKNTGIKAWKIFKGKDLTGTGVVVNPSEFYKIKWGHSLSTIVNDDSSNLGKYNGTFTD